MEFNSRDAEFKRDLIVGYKRNRPAGSAVTRSPLEQEV